MADESIPRSGDGKVSSASSTGDHTDALAALQGLGQQPVEEKTEVEARSGSATGFAAMLAHGIEPEISPRREGNSVSPDRSLSTDTANGATARPSKSKRQEFEELPMAKVVGRMDDGTGRVTIPPPRPKSRSRESYKIFIPIMAVLGILLLMIGMWALAAICGMSVPLMPGKDDPGYHSAIGRADFLLLALPLSLALIIMAFIMLRQLDRIHRATS